MATKKTKKKHTKLKKTGANKGIAFQKPTTTRLTRNKPAAKKKSANQKPALKKAKAKTKAPTKTANAKSTGTRKESVRGGTRSFDAEFQGLSSQSAVQSGDLQGLSNVERADSESVDELIEEGNAFEADVVTGVERAGDSDEKEVRTHEGPEDDVPEEYLDQE